MNKNYKYMMYKFLKNKGLELLFAITFVVLYLFFVEKIKYNDIIDVQIFFTLVATIIFQVIITILSKFLMNKFEDSIKLEPNYEKIVKKYSTPMIEYNNTKTNFNSSDLYTFQKYNKSNTTSFKFPIVLETFLNDKSLVIEDNKSHYELPSYIKENFNNLFKIHETSNIYNQLNIRVSKWEVSDTTFKLHTERTTFYNSLVTNRVMDFEMENGLTLRDLYQYGPFVKNLEDSNLSNHLGFNGFIVSNDGYVPFVKRNNNVSIGKSIYGNSVNASLKTKYSLSNDNDNFTINGLRNAIIHEINDELKIDLTYLKDFSLDKHLIAAYRDVVEGGKPQLLFKYTVNLTKDEINNNFKMNCKKQKTRLNKTKWDKELKQLTDGEQLFWIPVQDLKNIIIAPNVLVYNGTILKTSPSASACVVMLIKYLDLL